jgi:uncharacterized repeat protein (TIGR01451 family)
MSALSAVNNFASGSLIIPMDTTYQNLGMWKAYGLLYELLSKGIPVSWAIEPTKQFNGIDFTTSSKDLRTGTVITNYSYSGGPFVIASEYAAAAKPIIQSWWSKNANQPAVHEATVTFNSNVDIVLRTPPKIALEETNSGIAMTYFNAAGIPDLNGYAWSNASPNILDQEEIANGALFTRGACSVRRFDLFVTPHNGGYSYSLTDPTNLGTKTYAELDYFVNQGGGWVALCHSILSNENAIADLYKNSSPAVRALFNSDTNGGFLTYGGFTDIANGGGTWTVTEPELPVAQAVRTAPSVIQGLPGGSVQTWNRTTVSYYPQTELIANFTSSTGTIYDWGINGVAHNGEALGKVTFLGGHSYATSLPYTSNMEAPYLRFFFNALFFNGAAVAKLDLQTSVSDIPKGQLSEMILSLKNVGSSIATNTTALEIKLNIGVEYIDTLSGPDPVVTGNSSTGTTLTWGTDLGDIASYSTALEVKVEITPANLGEMKVAHFSAKYGDVYGEAFTADLCRAVNVYNGADPVIQKTPDNLTLYPGQVATWELSYRNSGASQLLNTYVEDILPLGFSFKSSVPAPSSNVVLEDGRTRLRWNIGTLAANSTSAKITLNAYVSKVISPPNYINTATIVGNDWTGYSYSKSDTAEVTIIAPPINLNKSVSPATSIDVTDPGQILTYTIRPSYYGDKLLDNVLVSDPIPAYTNYITGSVNAGGSYGYATQPKIDGIDYDTFPTKTTTISISAAPSVAKVGETVTVSMTITNNSGGAISNIKPSAAENLGGATLITGPSDAGFNLATGTSKTVTFTFKINETGERRFSGTAIGTLTVADDYTFTDGLSNTVLVVNNINSSPSNDLVIWRLGSNTPGIPGETLTSGYPAGVYAFRGGNTKEFSKYSLTSSSWSSKAQPTNGIEKGGSLTATGTGVIYGSEGNSKIFYKYDITANTWSRLADVSDNFNEGGSIQYLKLTSSVGSGVTATAAGEYVYALLGNSNRFRRYNVAGNTWTTLANVPVTVKGGGALTTDGTNLYALQGDRKTGFYKYDIATNTWSQLANTPGNVGWGGSLTRVGDHIYAMQGDGKTGFWRYTISTNSWTTLTPTLGNVADGGALTNDGTYIYALQGKTKTFWRYSITGGTWSTLTATNFTGSVGQGGALAYDPGVTPTGYFTSLKSNASLVTTGDTFKITQTIDSTTPVSNVNPGTVVITPTNGASATLVTGPTLVSTDNNISGSTDAVIYEWTYTATSGTLPGSITFKVNATGTTPATTFPESTSRSVIVSPELTFQARVFSPTMLPVSVEQITNVAMINDNTALGNGYDSNATNNLLLRPKLVIEKQNNPTGDVRPGNIITYTLILRNEGSGTAQNIVVTDAIPVNSEYVQGSAKITGSETVTADTTRLLSITEPVTLNGTLACSISSLKTDETITMTFEVAAIRGLSAGSYTISNFATVSATGQQNLISNTVTNVLKVIPSFTVLKLADPEQVLAPGEEIAYTVVITNTGDAELTNITVDDPLIPGLEYLEGNTDGDNPMKLDVNETWYFKGSYVATEADFNPGSEGFTQLTNTVTVDTNETDPQTAQEHVLLYSPNLSIQKTHDKTVVDPEGVITYSLVITNNGVGTAQSVVVTDVIPQYTDYVSGSGVAVGDMSVEEDDARVVEVTEPVEPNDPIVLEIDYLKSGESVTLTFKVKAKSGLPGGTYVIDNNATIVASTISVITSNTVSTTMNISIIKITKQVEPGIGYQLADDNTLFVIRVSNFAKGITTDLVLKRGETVVLNVPWGDYNITEIAVPMEYQRLSTGVVVFEDGIQIDSFSMASNNIVTVENDEVSVTFVNQFEHDTYFHSSDSNSNTFTDNP